MDVAETVVMYTAGENERTEGLAATTGCTDRDQTSRTVFRNRRLTGSPLRAAEGVTMLHLRAVDGAVPDPGGSRFAPPGNPTTAGTASGAIPHPASRTSRRRSGTPTADPAVPDGTVGEAVDDATPEGGNATGPVNVTGVERRLTAAGDGATDA